ncbi:MAG: hypothetical protein K8I30_04305 [Anaerolineae bacterium]|nr:hypothetical protein [Anaerolineae bacterium]
MIADDLYHYYDCSRGPFRNLSDLPQDEAEAILAAIRERGEGFASQRKTDYLTIRRGLEDLVRGLFIEKGGEPLRERPHYMVVGACGWLQSWFKQGCELHIPLANFDPKQVSFTYSDTFPAMHYKDGKPYRRQVYTLSELPELIQLYGLPQEWNADGKYGPDRYIEAQVWDDRPLEKWLPKTK